MVSNIPIKEFIENLGKNSRSYVHLWQSFLSLSLSLSLEFNKNKSNRSMSYHCISCDTSFINHLRSYFFVSFDRSRTGSPDPSFDYVGVLRALTWNNGVVFHAELFGVVNISWPYCICRHHSLRRLLNFICICWKLYNTTYFSFKSCVFESMRRYWYGILK